MADLVLATQVPPATPGAGDGIVFVDSISKKLSLKEDTGKIYTLDGMRNQSVASQTPFATETYLIGSAQAFLSAVPRVGTLYECEFDVVKTAAGIAAPVILVRFGTLGTTADALVMTFTFPAQTAVIDRGLFKIWLLFRTVGAAGVLQGRAQLFHELSVTGLSVAVSPLIQNTSAGFNTALANAILGITVNGGGSAAWTVQMVNSKVSNI